MSELAPATLEGWYALHQIMTVDAQAVRAAGAEGRHDLNARAAPILTGTEAGAAGWSAAFRLAGGAADIMLIHFRATLDEIAALQHRIRRSALAPFLRLEYDYLSVTEAGLYHATAEAAAQAEPQSGEYQRLLEEAAAAEAASPHVRSRLYPEPPADMRYVSFYPMSKRRSRPDNWYELPVAERNRLMREHGLTGRRYAGRVFQIITGSAGLDDWEWGVTLFARDPLEFKRIVTEMRYDEASARFGEFGEFYTGVRLDANGLADLF